MRYAFRQGPGRGFVAPLEAGERPLTTSFGSLPEKVATDRLAALVWGTVDLLEDTPYPALCPPLCGPVADRIQHALVMAFGLQRREPSNLFNDHRGLRLGSQPLSRPRLPAYRRPGVVARRVPPWSAPDRRRHPGVAGRPTIVRGPGGALHPPPEPLRPAARARWSNSRSASACAACGWPWSCSGLRPSCDSPARTRAA